MGSPELGCWVLSPTLGKCLFLFLSQAGGSWILVGIFYNLATDVFTLFLNFMNFEETVSCVFSWRNNLIILSSCCPHHISHELKSPNLVSRQRKKVFPFGHARPASAFVLTVPCSHACADPYVKVSLMCDGRRLKKRKTSTKRNTLNPVYNEAIVFDVPPESIDQIHLSIAVMDYDRWDARSSLSLPTSPNSVCVFPCVHAQSLGRKSRLGSSHYARWGSRTQSDHRDSMWRTGWQQSHCPRHAALSLWYF